MILDQKKAFFQSLMDQNNDEKYLLALTAAWLETPLGPMLAVGDEKLLYLLEFIDCKGLAHEINRLRQKTTSTIAPGMTSALSSIEKELKGYFNGQLKEFKTPLVLLGTPFQNLTWKALQQIPYGETASYKDIATAVCNPTAYRAVANANKSNQLAIVVPCHRVIKADGALCGYNGGVHRKKRLLEQEKQFHS